ncbi:uncharacterized protein PHACADRAFT_253505 [Phanerochaete carnosa HHB-10118-sp]|uniref:Uncharacterized protein n=1 Tax=Phanerochaete carnosa (strain HHB-10118-sp) TaxID=650164 RepID=K5X0Z3_PHACS|nr:uncharacterized protein PHACADRAFT_253505 [Phanerochaete carnosa HHB-10118-sp]EKM56412.1 hypothetical protein PHACADRAFT_253505 [Phanerochaete carnosa HHB-10118-sp]
MQVQNRLLRPRCRFGSSGARRASNASLLDALHDLHYPPPLRLWLAAVLDALLLVSASYRLCAFSQVSDSVLQSW